MPLDKEFKGISGKEYGLRVALNEARADDNPYEPSWYASFGQIRYLPDNTRLLQQADGIPVYYLRHDGTWGQITNWDTSVISHFPSEEAVMKGLENALDPPPGFDDVVALIIKEAGEEVLRDLNDGKLAELFGLPYAQNKRVKKVAFGSWGKVYLKR